MPGPPGCGPWPWTSRGPGHRRLLPGAHPVLPPARVGRARRRGDLESGGGDAGRGGRAPGGPGARRSPPSGSPTSARRWSPGTGRAGDPCTGPSCGRTGAPPSVATSCGVPGTSRWSGRSTGLVLDPYFSATKMEWLLGAGGVAEVTDDLVLGTVDAWLIWNLTGGTDGGVLATDATNASRAPCSTTSASSGVVRRARATSSGSRSALSRGAPRRAAASGSSPVTLPGPALRAGRRGRERGGRRSAGGPVRPGLFFSGDGQGHLWDGQLRPDRTSVRRARRLPRGCSPPSPGTSASTAARHRWRTRSEGAVFVTGAAVQWLRDGLGIIEESNEIGRLAEQIASTATGVYRRPRLHWAWGARGGIPTRGGPSSVSPGAPAPPTSPGRWSRRWRSRCATSWTP